jgi:Carboxypeptidase regulatory-like domain/TonB dependent receptor
MRRVHAFALILAIAVAPCLHGQSTNASLTGRISDPSKALIPDAKVCAINTGTNVRYETTSDDDGVYHLASLPPGSYRIEVSKPLFKTMAKPDVQFHVQDNLQINFEMAVGNVTETVAVEGGAPVVNSESGAVSTIVDRGFVDNLPLNGRSLQTLLTLTPGVVLTSTTFDNQGQFSVNGQRANANYFSVDGVSANFGVTGYVAMVHSASGVLPALSASGGTNSLVSVDALQEFRIQTSSFAPEYGRMPGGQVSLLTRSGTNAFHGTLFEYFRDSALDAKDWFTNFNGLSKPDQRLNDFGGVFSGPIVKDKTFFFFSHESLRLRQPQTKETVVPDVASRQAAPVTMQPYLNAYPVPNGPALGSGTAKFSASFSNPSKLDADSIRIDHAFNSRFNLFGRYNYSPSSQDQRAPAFTAGPVMSTISSTSSHVHTFTLGLSHVVTPTITNEVRANYSNQSVTATHSLDDFGGAVPVPDSILFPPGFTSANALLQLAINGVGQYNQGKVGTNEQRQINLVDNLSISRRRHQLKFGIDYRWLAPFTSPLAYAQFAQFSGVTAAPGGALSGTGVFTQSKTIVSNALLSQNFSFYAQDTWKVTPRLAVTYGLRWDVNPPLRGKTSDNDPFVIEGLDQPATMKLAPRGTRLYETTYGNFAPRLGIAYQLADTPGREMTLRGGLGMFYDLGQGSLGGVTTYFPYFASKSFTTPAAFPMSPQDAAPPAITYDPPVNTILAADPHLKLPKTYQWNVAVEQSMGKNQSVSLTYIGAIGRNLLRTTNLANPNPDFQFVSVTDNSTTSDYHAMQVKFERRLFHGFQAMASYTFSHSLDSASTDAFATYLNTPGAAGAQSDRGNSDFDIRHSFTAGGTYLIPTPRSHKVAEWVLGGWSLAAFVFARSAPPVDVVGSIQFAGGTALASRPGLNPGVPLEIEGSQYPGEKIFNKNAFVAAPGGQQGNFGRNVLRGFAASQADVALQRQFTLTERVDLRFRAEFFNIFNQANFGNPVNNVASPQFGRSTQTLASSLGTGGANGGLSPLYQVGGPRSIQFALKLQF